MKKRVLACILAMVFVLASAMTVSAAGSAGSHGSKASGVTVISPADKYEAVDSDVKFEGAGTDVTNKINGMEAITKVFEIKTKDGATVSTGDVVLQVDALGDKVDSVVLVVKGANGWKAIDAKVDGNKITVNLSEIGPAIVYAKLASSGATSPSTVGTSSTWMIMAAVALMAVGACVVVSQKKSR